MPGLLHRYRTMVVVPARVDTWVRLGLDRSFLHREKQARHVSVSVVVVHGRLQNDLDDVDRKDGCGS